MSVLRQTSSAPTPTWSARWVKTCHARRITEGIMSRAAILLLLAVAVACDHAANEVHSTAASPAAVYQCPMHPQIIRHEPGDCPICGMALRRVDDAANQLAVAGHAD